MAMVVLLLGTSSGCSSHHERLKENVDTLHINITLNPFKPGQRDPGGGLRSLLLHQGLMRIEPHSIGPDGTPGSSDAIINERKMLGLVDDLERLGLWKDAELYDSKARPNPRTGPPAGRDFARTHRTVHPSCEIQAIYASGDYHSYVVITIPWGNRTIDVLKRLKGNMPASLADKLVETCQRFP